MSRTRLNRVLAIDLRPQQFGYAAFETQSKLIDWGIRGFSSSTLEARTSKLLEHLQPSVIVVRRKSPAYERRHSRFKAAKQILRRTCKKASVQLVDVSNQTLLSFSQQYPAKNKYEIAAIIAKKFPELSWRLPSYTKPWESEHWRMPIFDAVFVGITYLDSADRVLSPASQSRS